MDNLVGSRSRRAWRHVDWTLRIALISVFLYHGIPKWLDLPATAEALKLPLFITVLVALAEVGGSLLIIFGGLGHSRLFDWATRFAGFSFMAVMTGAILLVHWGQWANAPTPQHPAGGIEFPLILWLIGLFFLLRGNGGE
jgi:putative oxidoreductase